MVIRLKSGFPSGLNFIFEFERESDARCYFAQNASEALAILKKWGCLKAVARIPGQADTEICASILEFMAGFELMPDNPVVKLFFADVSLPVSILQLALDQSASESRWGIVRLTDQRQVIMSSGMNGVLLAGVTLDETTNWKRPEFWHPSDLFDFNRDWKRELESEGNRLIERRYRIRRPGTDESWQWYTSNFRLIEAEDGLSYHLGVFVDRE